MFYKQLNLSLIRRISWQALNASLQEMPYGLFLSLYAALWILFLLFMRRLGYPWPQQIGGIDLLLLSLATFRLTVLLTEEKVAQSIRAPFCERIVQTKPDGTQVEEEMPAGCGLRRVIGELLLCPWCASVWIATLLILVNLQNKAHSTVNC